MIRASTLFYRDGASGPGFPIPQTKPHNKTFLGSSVSGQTRTTDIHVMSGQYTLKALGVGVLAQDILTIPGGSAAVELIGTSSLVRR